jgi:hypothetical protein
MRSERTSRPCQLRGARTLGRTQGERPARAERRPWVSSRWVTRRAMRERAARKREGKLGRLLSGALEGKRPSAGQVTLAAAAGRDVRGHAGLSRLYHSSCRRGAHVLLCGRDFQRRSEHLRLVVDVNAGDVCLASSTAIVGSAVKAGLTCRRAPRPTGQLGRLGGRERSVRARPTCTQGDAARRLPWRLRRLPRT